MRARLAVSVAIALGLGSALGLGALAAAQVAPLFAPGGGPVIVAGPLGDDAACAGCHQDVADEWRTSMHAQAGTDAVFLAEHRPRPDPACVRCHAPAVPAEGDIDHPRAALGVSCVACHVRDGAVLSAQSPSGRAPHPSRRDRRLAGVEACATCHQFGFSAPPEAEGGPSFDPAAAQQDTIAEWRRTADRRACQECHMPEVARGGRSHAFPGLDDVALRSRALRVEARAVRRRDAIDVTLRIRAGHAGHAVPTGDLFRRLRVEARAGDVVVHEDLRRYFGAVLDGDAFVLRERDDTRVPPPGRGARVVRLRLPRAESDEIEWSVSVLRLDPDVAHARGLDPARVRVPLASGRVTAH